MVAPASHRDALGSETPRRSDADGAVPPESELVRTLVDSVTAMLAFWDVSQRCRFANKAYERWFGLPAAALIGKHIGDLLGPTTYAATLPYIEGALRGEPQAFEREIPDPSGGPSEYLSINYAPHVVGGVVHGFFVLATDITASKRAALALRESEERFRLTIDEAPIGMALVGTDGRFIRVNRMLCELVGYTAEELTATTFHAILHPDDLDADLTQAGRLARGEIPRYTLGKRYVRKDGRVVDVMLSLSLLRGPDGAPQYFISQVEDVTERKRLEEQLRFAEARSSGILEISADAVVAIDEDQRITLFNAGAEQIFGYSRAEAIGAPLDILIPEPYRATHRRHVETFSRGATVARRMGERGAALFGLRKDGSEFPADASISKLEVGGRRIMTVALRDITEQKRIEDEQRFLAEVGPVLATSLEYEETMTRIAELAVRRLADFCIVDLFEDDEIRRVKVACRDSSKGWVCDVLTNVQLDRRREHLMWPVLRTRQSYLQSRPTPADIEAFAQSDEHLRALHAAEIRSVVAVPLMAQTRILGAMALISSSPARIYGPADVRLAEQLAQRAALSITNARLFREAHSATKARDDVLGVVAHDLRNPLSAILLQAAALQRRSDDPNLTRSIAAIERSARRMDRLIHDLLDITRMEAGELSVAPRRLPARQLVVDACEAQRSLVADAGHHLRLELPPTLPDVWADRDRLLQVFENLIGNAAKFTRPGGRIVVGAAPRDGDVLFWVADTGCGIPAEDLPYLFDRFWQARKEEGRSAGLGLSIVKSVVESHCGRVWVESTPGKGSAFYFTVPTIARPEP
jgi:PAS domain S-box-containing protein